jgi:hypothetical protein
MEAFMKMDIGRIVLAVFFSVGTMAVAQVTQNLQIKEAKPKESSFELTMKCSYTPVADEQSSGLPTYPVGFMFSKEKNNDGKIGVDVFKINDQAQPIKLVGHAELSAAGYQLAEDSPFDFEILLPEAATTLQAAERFSATVTVMTTFTGEYFSNLTVNCRQVGKSSSNSLAKTAN